MRFFTRSILSAILSLSFLLSLLVSIPHPAGGEEKLPLNIDADEVVWNRKEGAIIAKGFAHVRYGNTFIAADRMEYHPASGNLAASGNVVLEYEDSRIFAQRMDFNVNTTLGVLYNAEGYIGGAYFITGKKVHRISEREYRFEEGSFTTCRCDDPAWLFTLKKGTLYLDRFAVLRGAAFKVKGLSVAALPIALVPAKTERSTGFLFPSFGTSSLDGFTLENRFFWAINQQSDVTLGLDYLSKRGLRPNLEYRYLISKNARGRIFGSILEDRVNDTTFFEVRGGHYQRFKHDVVSELKIDIESSISPAREFDLDVERRAKVRTDSFLYARKNWRRRALQMENRFFKSTLSREAPSFAMLPELTFFNTRERLFSTPFYYDLNLAVANFIEELPGGENRNLSRVDFFPRLSLPIGSLSWWDLTQTVGFRETAYSEQRGSGKPVTRELFFSQTMLEVPRLFRSYAVRLGKIDRIVHIVEPVVTYTYVSDNEAGIEGRILSFDEVDDFGAASVLAYSLTNRLVAREVGEGGRRRVREIARVTLGQSYDIREERSRWGGDPLSEVLIDVETWFLPSLRVNFDALYSLEEDSLETMNFEVDYRFLKYLNFVFDSRLKRGRLPAGLPRTDYIRAGIGANLGERWYLEYAARINLLLKKEVTESSFILSYTSQCWGLKARLVDREDETTVDFQIELLGLGGLGKKINPTVSPHLIPRL